MRRTLAVVVTLLAALVAATPALATFPYGSGPDRKLPPGTVPNDLGGDAWKFAATAESGSPWTSSALELFGVRGAHVVDATASASTAWQTTVGRPDVAISVLDSGIRWNDAGAMSDLRRKVRLNRQELPLPQGCTQYDCNGDSVFNVDDYSGDSRVNLSDSRRVGPGGVMTPQDLLIAFSDGTDADNNGFVDDIAGWDFLDNDNDAYDDVQYDHGTGQSKGSSAEANNGGQPGTCPNCMFVPLRVGDSFVADVSNFAQAVIYSVDNDVLVVQEAEGTLNNSRIAREAIDYGYKHGVAVIASAADEAAQHHNWPSNYPHTIVVNSVNKYNDPLTPNRSYLQFNGCTNFSTKVTLAIPSSTCSSNATGLGSGFAGLVYSAALNARDHGNLANHPTCTRVNGDPCVLSVNEVRQLMATGTINGVLQVDDVNFATQPEAACYPAPAPGCTDKNRLFADAAANRPSPSPLAETRSYPARKGYDEYYGYGRANMDKVLDATDAGTVPPEAEITSPEWYAQIDPSQPTVAIEGQVFARSQPYTCRVEIAPGSEPNNGRTTDIPPGDFEQVSSSWCNEGSPGATHTTAFDGVLANVDIAHLKSRFPVNAGSFNGPEPTPGPPNFNGRPNTEPYGFVVRVVVTSVQGSTTLTGQDRRNFYLHHDQDLLPGFPKTLSGDGESSPVLVDLDGDNRNEVVFGSADGFVHAWKRDGTELAGWPVRTDALPLHTAGQGFTSGAVDEDASHASILSSISVVDLDHDGVPEVMSGDMHGKLYVWEPDGSLRFKREANVDFSGKPLSPFVNVRKGKRFRTQHGFIGSPVAADLDGNGGPLEIIAANMDRHVYAWHADGSAVAGFPVLVIDRSKITAIDPQTHAPTFATNIGEEWNQGAIIDTTALGDLTGDGKPEIVVGTNEEYDPNGTGEGGVNAGNLNTASLALLAQSGQLEFANNRLYAIKPEGEPGGPTVSGPSPYLTGWPKKLAFINKELLPIVGEGITGSPVIGTMNCQSGGTGPKVAASSAAGPVYLFNPNGSSCYGQSSGHDNAMQTDFSPTSQKYDTPAIPAVGHPTFGNFGGGTSLIVPAAGVLRALDLAVNEYQAGQDFIASYDPLTGQFRSGFPSPVNDLSFITGPSVADLDGLPGEEIVGGTASLDLYGMNASGASFDPTAWPKLTADWTVANPVVGSLGTLDTDSSARKVVVALTRTGAVFAYGTDAPACSASSWPRFHHDNASSGDFGRDAVSPGKPTNLTFGSGNLSLVAPGDDLLCGTADHYQLVTSDDPIDESNFDSATPLAGAPAPQAAGSTQTFPLPAGARRFVAIRAVDEQGNVGRPASVQVKPGYPRPKGATPLLVSLTPAYEECTTPNSTHGAPLSRPSCTPPQPESGYLTVGSPDANGKVANSIGSVRFDTVVGDPSTTADEADVLLTFSLTDVRDKNDLSDYGGELQANVRLRMTDRYNGASGSDAATVTDMPLPVAVPCSPTAETTIGAKCAITTGLDGVVPNLVNEGKRAIWELGQIEIYDGGADGQASTEAGNTVFARQGIFVP
jgi:hypothetical protein